MKHAWGESKAVDQMLEPGTRVARPERAGGCWATVTTAGYQGKLVRPRICRGRAQPNRCTCRNHAKLDDEAQALKRASATE